MKIGIKKQKIFIYMFGLVSSFFIFVDKASALSCMAPEMETVLPVIEETDSIVEASVSDIENIPNSNKSSAVFTVSRFYKGHQDEVDLTVGFQAFAPAGFRVIEEGQKDLYGFKITECDPDRDQPEIKLELINGCNAIYIDWFVNSYLKNKAADHNLHAGEH